MIFEKRNSHLVISEVLVLLIILVLASRSDSADLFTGKVVSVSDGDTLSVMRDGRAVKVRLWGIDTPEKAQPFGQKAKQFTSDAVFGKVVTVQVQDTDRYGRIVGVVVLGDGTKLNQALVDAGLAWWYRDYAPGEQCLSGAELEARNSKRGLWSEASQTPPWEWRKEKRRSVMPKDDARESDGRSGCLIKGNINRKGKRVYHLPGSRWYAKTQINEAAGDRWFCSEEEAIQSGWLKVR